MTIDRQGGRMDVTVAADRRSLRIVISGELDDTAPEIVQVAAGLAASEGVPLVVDTSAAYPRRSPILRELQEFLEDMAVEPSPPPDGRNVAW